MKHARLETLDGLRGSACLAVIIFHFFSAFVPQLISEQSEVPWWISDTPVGIIYNGGFAVSIFFVLSGFVVASAVRAQPPLIFVWIALCRRYLRLAIPSACSTVLALHLLTAMPEVAPQLQSLLPQPWLTYVIGSPFPSLADAVFEGALGVFVSGSSLINNVLWTMKIELIGSFAIILTFSILRGHTRNLALVLLAAGLLINGRPEYGAFMLGALLCVAYRHNHLKVEWGAAAMLFAIVVGAWTKGFGDRIGLPLSSTLALGEPHKVWHTAAAVSLVYAALTYRPLMKLLSSPIPMFLGRISFGLYLLHVPLIYTAIGALYLWLDNHDLFWLCILFLAFLFTCVVSGYLFTVMIDEPVIKGLREIQRRLFKTFLGSSSEKAMS
jgi:peptidoglycan/LPS O-acetylase OafA/YrhL